MKYYPLQKSWINRVLRDNNINYKTYGNRKDVIDYIYNCFKICQGCEVEEYRKDWVSWREGSGFTINPKTMTLAKVVGLKDVGEFKFRTIEDIKDLKLNG